MAAATKLNTFFWKRKYLSCAWLPLLLIIMRKQFLLYLCLFSIYSFGQSKPVIYQQQVWAGFYPQLKLSRHWGLWFDSEVHSNDHYFNGYSQMVFRFAGTYYNNKQNKFTAGYGFTDYFPGDNHKYISLPEHFFWQQYQWYHYPGKSKIMQWVRLEQKFKEDVIDNYTLADTYTLTYRARYNFYCTIPLSKRGLKANTLAVALGNELYVYYAPHLPNRLFDQDRVFLGFSYAVNPHDNLVFGMTNIFQEDVSGTQFKNNNVLRVSFFQNIGMKTRHAD